MAEGLASPLVILSEDDGAGAGTAVPAADGGRVDGTLGAGSRLAAVSGLWTGDNTETMLGNGSG